MALHPRFRLNLVVIALTLLYSGLSKAEDVAVNPITPGSLPALSSDNLSSNVFFPLYPRLNVSGGTGNNNYGAADVMAPLFGSTNAIVYTDIAGQTGKGKSNFISLGLGARDAVNEDIMWGGYAFIDRSKANDSDGGNHWTVINPGIEFMTNNWDGRVNGYIPTGNKENSRGPFFGDQVDQPGAVHPTGHDVFSQLFNKVDEIGPGIDADAGYTFTSLRRFRVHGGGYYFTLPDTGDIKGGEAGAEMPINNYAALQFDDSYDDVQRNKAVVSVRFTLGGIDKFANDPTVQDRILDPIYRHLGALGTNTGIPSNNGLVEISRPPVLEQSNVWFYDANSSTAFNPSAGLDNCTFEHPCRGPDFNQDNINIINGISPNANFYFKPGTYTFAAPNNLDLYAGQSMYGRNSTYALPASSASGFPTFVGEIDPLGNNTLDSFALINNAGSQPIGIHIQNVNNVLMNNLQIGQLNTTGGYITSIQSDNANNITIQNSLIQSGVAGNDSGIINNGGSATINTNTFNITNSIQANGLTNNASSIIIATNNTFNLNATTINGVFNIGAMTLTDNIFTSSSLTNQIVIGISNLGGTVTATGNTFHLNGSGSVIGVSNRGGTNITLDTNTFTLTSLGIASNSGTITGLDNRPVGAGTGTATLSNNTFTLGTTGASGVIKGIITDGSGPVVGTPNTFTLTGTNPSNAGGDATFFGISGNTCTLNGGACP